MTSRIVGIAGSLADTICSPGQVKCCDSKPR
jgi:hypothetical protein